MKAEEVKVAVIRIEGTNCEEEAERAWTVLGANAEKVHLNQLTGKAPSHDLRKLEDYHALFIPGGFSAGDYIRAGAMFAARLKAKLGGELKDFVEQGKPVIGVCNGFQILAELGLLPGMDGAMSPMPEAVLMTNHSGRFECRPSLLKHENKGKCIFTTGIENGKVLQIPSAHAEGKLQFPIGEEEKWLDRLFENDQIVFRYVDENGEYAGYPWNPNGSARNIAGICNGQGNVFGLMPHPERVLHRNTHNDWTRKNDGKDGDGLAVFRSALEYVTKKW
ncbi:MAG: phosphoribosylformylglycinamidine synthase subunit PurQ [Candidatus Thermoplasmatota archaeon]|nr:phosphoribosylformylglycinamidine synthase subunit PurQ [Candidatus Thermoplasmatota archaeon]